MEDKDKVKWFKQQCKAEGLSAEDIVVFGDYATNRDGDFLYSVKHKDGRYTMNYVVGPDLADCESIYPEWLLRLTENLEENYRVGDEILQSRSWWDRREIARCFKEAICRNAQLPEGWREELRRSPTMGVYRPDVPLDMRRNDYEQGISYGMYPGEWDVDDDSEHIDEKDFEYRLVYQPDEMKSIEGYRFALKVVDLDDFIQIYSYQCREKQRGPFQMLAELEKRVIRAWRELDEVRDRIYVWQEAYGCVAFTFSHFEVENEPDENFRTIFVVYSHSFDV